MTRLFRTGILTLFVSLLLLASVPIWRLVRQQRQERLDLALVSAVKLNDSAEVVSLLNQGADANATPTMSAEKSYTPLIVAANHNISESGSNGLKAGPGVFSALLKSGADPNVRDKRGSTPLFYAVIYDDLKVARILIDSRADVNAPCQNGETALHEVQSTAIFDLLLNHGAKVNVVDTDGCSPLIALARHDCTALVKEILKRGAKVNAQDNEGQSALMAAAYDGQVDMIHVLLAAGADTALKTQDGATAADAAEYHKFMYRTPNRYELVKRMLQPKHIAVTSGKRK